ncbi:hypothetical protein Q3G72_012616 [Acer saccharum]|nr:hypothetical protein Q3G72_012616 [Acer saccharum]
MCVDLSFLVLSFSYEKRYIEEVKLQSSEQIKDVAKEPSKIEIIPKSEAQQSNQQSKTSTSSAREQELDVFLLGGESDEDPVLLLCRPPTVRLGACEDYPLSLTMLLLVGPCGIILIHLQEGNESVATRVAMLILPKKGLKGIISRSLGRLDKLKLLDLSCNHFEGVLPAELSNLKQLQVLDLSHNMLTGRVSPVLSGLKMIQSLNVSSNSFSGDLMELGGFPNLLVFNVSNNSFTGILNSQIWSASNGTEILDLSMNHFVGNLEGLDNCSSSLKELHVDVNSLSGHLPGSLYSFPSLQQLSLSENYFSGHLSKELSKLTSLNYLIIFGNHFSGELPNVFGNHTNRVFMIIENCSPLQQRHALVFFRHFIGKAIHHILFNTAETQCPRKISAAVNDKVLDLRNNSLTGSIDLNFTGLPSLGILLLGSNRFSGPLPNSLADCHQLKILSLAKNGFAVKYLKLLPS